MNASSAVLLNWLLFFPFVAAVVIAAFPRILRLLPAQERSLALGAPGATAVATVLLSLGVAGAMGAAIAREGYVYADYLWTPAFFQLRLRLDALGFYALLAILAALLPTAVWASATGARDHLRWAGFAGALGAFTGVVLAADLVVLYIFWELSALALWVALAPPFAPGKRFLAWSHAGGLCVLVAVLLVAGMTLDTHIYSAGPGLLMQRLSWVKWVGLLLLVGLAFKLGLAPAHSWLRDLTHAGSGIWGVALPGVGLVTAGYGAIRLVSYILPSYAAAALAWLPALLGLITVVYAGMRALLADDPATGVSFLLAAAAGQVAFALGVGMRGASAGLTGAIALLLPLALGASLLGAGGAGGLGAATWRDLRGRFRSAPAQGTALLAGVWTLAGAPPLAGFWAQRAVVAAARHEGVGLSALALIAPILFAAYGVRAATIGFARDGGSPGREPRWRGWWVFGVVLLSAALGMAPGLWMPYVLKITQSLTGG
ncbi:MAG TPA: proton-conducting transporter membrane subunit [Armatimonadota bacterium]|nr:proton-conducting transporter membrane subunit [Armatimonadota bacterium]